MAKYALVCMVILMASCTFSHKAKVPYQGFSTTDDITYYRYCDMGADKVQAHKGTFTEVAINYAKMNDSVFWSSRKAGYPYTLFLSYAGMASDGTFQRQLLKTNPGDSLIYIVPADSVFQRILHLPLPYFLHKGDKMKVHVRVKAIIDSVQYSALQKAISEYKRAGDMQEQLTLLRYITAHNIPDSCKRHNVYVIVLRRGTGPPIRKGDIVSLAYTGSFLSGKVFDSVPLDAPMQFKYGDTAQVIGGLDTAIKMMHQGEEAKIIIPSQLAFGNNGSSTGIVPPYTTVVYEVTLLKKDPATK